MIAQGHQARHHHIVHGTLDRGGNFLRQRGHPQSCGPHNGPQIRLHVARQQAHEGGFARAITADQTDPFPGIDLEVHSVENRWSTEGMMKIE